MKVESHGGHYYVDPKLWEKDKVIGKAKEAAMHTGHSQLIHPHTQKQRCGVKADHIIVYPNGFADQIRVVEPDHAQRKRT